jgi:hypothetical protein
MTKAELKKSHDAMARFLIKLCRHNDASWYGASDEYRQARKLIEKAGMKYKPRPRT